MFGTGRCESLRAFSFIRWQKKKEKTSVTLPSNKMSLNVSKLLLHTYKKETRKEKKKKKNGEKRSQE